MNEGKPVILLVEDEEDFRNKMKKSFGGHYTIVFANSGKAALETLRNSSRVDLILLDLSLSGELDKLDGLQLIKPIKQKAPHSGLVVVTKDKKSRTVVDALRAGADDFVRKDEFDEEAWRKLFGKYIGSTSQQAMPPQAAGTAANQQNGIFFIGQSHEILEIKRYLTRLSEKPDITVLLTGETGVGKEVAARYMHQHGIRKDRPFIAVNLSAITSTVLESNLFGHRKGAFTDAREDFKGAFEQAHTGILFLDEIGEIDHNIQVKLLRFLENKVITPVGGRDIQLDVQIIAATNRNLKDEVSKGAFRSDLYYRLVQFEVRLPALRERKEDIELLISHYLEKYGETAASLTEMAREHLLGFSWPGNVRQLVNTLRKICVDKDLKGKHKIDETLLPPDIQAEATAPAMSETDLANLDIDERLARVELDAIEKALNNHPKKGDAARALGLNLDQLKYKIEKHQKLNPQILKDFPLIRKKYKI